MTRYSSGSILPTSAGQEPAVVEAVRLRILVVLRTDPRAAHEDLADRLAIVRQAVEVLVEDVEFEAGQ